MNDTKKSLIIGCVCAGILIVGVISYLIYSNNNSNESELKVEDFSSVNSTEEIDNTVNVGEYTESASTEIGKTVEESKEELKEKEAEKETSKTENTETNITNGKSISTSTKSSNTTNSTSKNETSKEDTNTIPEFCAPVNGEIIREFASESLVYSETLQEWITHNGIDIKADKTSVVSSAADGTVYAIKNDPRYGLTVIVNHKGGYQTVYSNLLTAEFVVEGEEIKVGQTIGTVGNSATFEISDDYHLHFEILKDNQYIDPTTCINF